MNSLEKSLRTDAFEPGVTLRLLNGEEFHFERPIFRGVYPTFDEGGKIRQRVSIHFGPEWEECVDSAEATITQGGNIWPYVAWLGDTMLTHRNYRTEIREHYRDILYFNGKDDTAKAVWDDVYNIALGIDPKGRSSVG